MLKMRFLNSLAQSSNTCLVEIKLIRFCPQNSQLISGTKISVLYPNSFFSILLKGKNDDYVVPLQTIFEANDPGYVKVKELLENTDINTISPVEALLKLNEMKMMMVGKK